jgi:hypothetical protein
MMLNYHLESIMEYADQRLIKIALTAALVSDIISEQDFFELRKIKDIKIFCEKLNELKSAKSTDKIKYEIICFKTSEGNFWDKKEGQGFFLRGASCVDWFTGWDESHFTEKSEIISVKRLIDGEIFTVQKEHCASKERTDDYPNKRINKFFIREGVMYAQFDEGKDANNGCLPITSIKKVATKTYARPPAGITPRYIWMEQRKEEIEQAMKRYAAAGIDFPKHFHEEYLFVITHLNS